MSRTRKSKPASVAAHPVPEGIVTAATTAPVSKIAQVTAMLDQPRGATLAELVAATGWLPHTTRAALTGLRKNGHTLDKHSREGVTVYTIAKVA